ncbi:uncharacterized protein LOC116336734 [Contarinia nasturtii]|uniref:uncharacterized protein LOC116336734 n=1 Tax=Contarinia nasturtii TaxID=265458 RepID=UPI0012D38C66|nr:uncharacterized protein LOC116336734 [Contarinia nasturtii]
MELNWDTYDLVCEQVKQCLLPELDRDIGDEPLAKEDFSMFRYGLEMNLQLLFDIVAKNERLLLESFEGKDNTFRVNFMLLIHQQSGYDEAPFQTDSRSISKQIRFLIDKYYKKIISETIIQTDCSKYYKERLTADKWKRNIGAVYGFLQMNNLHQTLIQTKFKTDDCLFMLSVGMNLTDYFEPSYKKFGLIIFNILIDYGDPVELQKLNIYRVVFEKLIKTLIKIITDESGTVLILSCAYKCIETFDGWRTPVKWNEVDDALEEVMKRIPFEVDNRCTAILFMFVCRVTTLPMEKSRIFSKLTDVTNLDYVIETAKKSAEDKREIFNELRNIFSSHHNLLIARWLRRLVKIFQDRDIIGKAEEIRFMLFIMHILYICAFYGSPWFMGMKWNDLLHEFVCNLMKLVANNFNREMFIEEIYAILDTLKLHLEIAERTPDFFKDEHEEQVTNFIESIHKIIPELEQYCVRKKNEDEEERLSRKSELSLEVSKTLEDPKTSEDPNMPEEESN